jgi:Phosphotransferase enzyme family
LTSLADLRFLLPRIPVTAALLGVDEWRDPLTTSGVEVVPVGAMPDLVVADSSEDPLAGQQGVPMVILIGSRRTKGSALPSISYRVQPSLGRPRLVSPIGRDFVASPGGGGAKHRFRSALYRGLSLLPGSAREARAAIHVASEEGITPAFISAASDLAAISVTSWSLHLRSGSGVRNHFLLYADDTKSPTWALKFVRDRGLDRPFIEEERSLLAVREVHKEIAHHVPQHLGRFSVAGYPASLETAVQGTDLRSYLRSPATRSSKLDSISRVSDWVHTLATESRAPAESLQPERERVARLVLPEWGIAGDLVRHLSPIPAVMQHNDLTPHNVLVAPGSFAIVDWSLMIRNGFPLWDQVIFLTTALADLDGARSNDELDEHFRSLFRGTATSSAFFFRRLHDEASMLGIGTEDIGKVITLAWLEYAWRRRRYEHRVVPQGQERDVHTHERRARIWLSDAGLGLDWRLP